MKKRYYLLSAIMLWMFSSVSFASMTPIVSPSPAVSLTFTDGVLTTSLNLAILDKKSFILAEDWLHLVFGHIGSFGGGFGHEHHGDWGHGEHHGDYKPPCDDPAPVPLPSAVWLFGSVLSGLIGLVTRRQSRVLMA